MCRHRGASSPGKSLLPAGAHDLGESDGDPGKGAKRKPAVGVSPGRRPRLWTGRSAPVTVSEVTCELTLSPAGMKGTPGGANGSGADELSRNWRRSWGGAVVTDTVTQIQKPGRGYLLDAFKHQSQCSGCKGRLCIILGDERNSWASVCQKKT